jgi:hypothetical protein
MSNILDEVLNANKSYAETFGEKAKLAMPPARQFAILTSMDARLDPAKFAGLAERRRSRNSQRGRQSKRRCNSFTGDLV